MLPHSEPAEVDRSHRAQKEGTGENRGLKQGTGLGWMEGKFPLQPESLQASQKSADVSGTNGAVEEQEPLGELNWSILFGYMGGSVGKALKRW